MLFDFLSKEPDPVVALTHKRRPKIMILLSSATCVQLHKSGWPTANLTLSSPDQSMLRAASCCCARKARRGRQGNSEQVKGQAGSSWVCAPVFAKKPPEIDEKERRFEKRRTAFGPIRAQLEKGYELPQTVADVPIVADARVYKRTLNCQLTASRPMEREHATMIAPRFGSIKHLIGYG